MNLKELFILQKKLDQKIIASHKLKNNQYFEEKKIALLVELGEFANEIATFKYWKKHKNHNLQKIKEEYVDVIHFLISLGINFNLGFKIDPKIKSKNINKQLLLVFNYAAKLINHFSLGNIKKVFSLYLGLGMMINLTEEEIKKAYIKKNNINFERLKNNY